MCENCPDNGPKTFCTTCYRDKDCDVKINAACVYYHLYDNEPSNLECLGIPNKVNLEAILDEIDEKLCDFTSMQTPLTANDSTSINFTTSGTGNHTLTGSVIIDPDEDNIITITDNGLFATGSGLLNFNNGLTRTGSLVQLGGDLVKNTVINGLTYSLNIDHSANTNLFSEDFNEFYKEGITNAVVNGQTDSQWSCQVSPKSSYNGSLGYYTGGYINTLIGSALLSYYYGVTNTGNPAPSNTPLHTSYVRASDAELYNYAAKQTWTVPANTHSAANGNLITGRTYKIKSNGGGADFTLAGAPNSLVNTVFIANGTQPDWGTGTLELYGEFTHKTGDVTVYQSNDIFRVAANSDTFYYFNKDSLAVFIEDSANDEMSVHVINDSYAAFTICKPSERANIAFLSEASLGMVTDYGNNKEILIGVTVPTTLDFGSAQAPSNAAKTAFTSWKNESASSVGIIRHYAAEHRIEGNVIIKDLDSVDVISDSAAFEVKSTTKGLMPPRMTTTQRNAIVSPDAGLIIYNTTTNKHQGYNGSIWNDFY